MTESERVTACLVIPIMSYYDDNWYEDYTLNWGAMNPDRLFSDTTLAHEYIEQQTLRELRLYGITDSGVISSGQIGRFFALKDASSEKRSELLGLVPSSSLTQWLDLPSYHTDLPENLDDAELLALTRALDVRFFYTFETDVSAQELSEALAILETTPERPEIREEPVLVGNLNNPCQGPIASRPLPLTLSPDEAAIAARLERVTQLFGKRYATRLDY